MKAITFNSPFGVKTNKVANPEIIGPEDLIVDIICTALCGSDLHALRGVEQGLDTGTVMGHEFGGKVVEVGEKGCLKVIFDCN